MRQRIETAIKDAERGTRAEFVAVMARRTDDYAETSLVVGLTAAAIAGIAAWRLLPWPGGAEILTAEFAAFLLGFALTHFTSLNVRLTRRTIREHKARRLARSIFLQRGLASTDEHCGVMFFVARGERFVEIIADRSIDQKVDAGSWQKVVDDFTAAVRAGDVEKGFAGAIAAIGAILALHYPATGDNPNEISNRLIEI
jgi:putative membrane protein